MDRLFVYGIFLGENMRRAYGMSNPRYATVLDYATWGHHIVQAHKQKGAGLALTGLLVDVAPYMTTDRGIRNNWAALDALEGGYDRIVITTTDGDKAFMYVGKELHDEGSRSGSSQSSKQGEKEPVSGNSR
jgi:hypothetical protein